MCNNLSASSWDFSGGEDKGGFSPPLEMVFPPELCLNDKIDFNMIKVLPPSIFKRLSSPLNLFSRKIPEAYPL